MVVDGHISQDVAEKYFPELVESEDEKTGKELLTHLEYMRASSALSRPKWERMIGWVKKQKGLESISLSSLTWKDINTLEDLINQVHHEYPCGISEKGFGEEVIRKFIEIEGDRFEK